MQWFFIVDSCITFLDHLEINVDAFQTYKSNDPVKFIESVPFDFYGSIKCPFSKLALCLQGQLVGRSFFSLRSVRNFYASKPHNNLNIMTLNPDGLTVMNTSDSELPSHRLSGMDEEER